MPRIRGLKPEFFKDEDLVELPPDIRLFYAGLWCYADRDGRLEYRPKYLKSEIFPYNQKFDVELALKLLAHPNLKNRPKKVFIRIYHPNGSQYIDIPEFSEHQRPHYTEKKSIIPAYISSVTVNEPLVNRKYPLEYGEGEGEGEHEEKEIFILPDFISKESWDGFVEMRKKSGKPFTTRAKKLIIKKLLKLKESGDDPNDVLDQSTERSYLGVFPLSKQKEDKYL